MTTNEPPEEPELTLDDFTPGEILIGLRVAAAALGRATMHYAAVREELRGVRAGRDVLVGLLSDDGDDSDFLLEELSTLRRQITQAHLALNELGVDSCGQDGQILTAAERIMLLAKQLIVFTDAAVLSVALVNGNGGQPE